MQKFTTYINEIVKQDNLESNDLLWEIIYYFHNLINQGINNDLLEKILSLISLIDGFVNYSLNTDNITILDNVENLLKLLHQYNFSNEDLKLNMKFLAEYKQSEKELIEHINLFKNKENIATLKKLL
ncbi:hypothetical protein CLOHAE12215_01843 [Clostridium haemolyticum]|nr:hypothetical protein CLOHAE12215_01843 [Clostridium haemolyticum]